MDPRTFDGLVQRFAGARTRRSVLAGSLLSVLGFGEATLAKNRHKSHAGGTRRRGAKAEQSGTVSARARLNVNEQCPRKKHGKKLTCDDCRTGFSVPYTNPNGKTVRRCACKPVGEPCTAGTAANCCSAVCGEDGQCATPLLPGQVCTAFGISCTANAQCCNGICNLGGSDIGPTVGPTPGTANKCAACLTGGATCDPNDSVRRCCRAQCIDIDAAGPGTTFQCYSNRGETCTPVGSTAAAPAVGNCGTPRLRCPVAGNVGPLNVCCQASGEGNPSGSGDCDGCCTGQCDSSDRCCAPAGQNPMASGAAACSATTGQVQCCDGGCSAATAAGLCCVPSATTCTPGAVVCCPAAPGGALVTCPAGGVCP